MWVLGKILHFVRLCSTLFHSLGGCSSIFQGVLVQVARVASCSLIADHEDERSHSSLWLELWRLLCTSFAPIWVCDLAYLARLLSSDNWWKFSNCSDWLRVTGAWTYCVWGVVMIGSAEKGTCTILYCCQTPDCSTWELGAAQCREGSPESLHGERLFVLAYWPLYSGDRSKMV